MGLGGRLLALWRDLLALWSVCGGVVAAKWLVQIVIHVPEIAGSGNLQPADLAMGEGPFACRLGRATALLTGPQVMSGIREIWCRNVYLGQELEIRDGDSVVDLGANIGNFTMLALAHGPNVRVVAVEPNQELNALMQQQLRLNGWEGRCVIVNGFVGVPSHKMEPYLGQLDADAAAKGVTLQRLLAMTGGHIDLLKCDIEGGEFSILRSGVGWIENSAQIALELHFDSGSLGPVRDSLHQQGFEVVLARESSSDAICRAWRREK